MKMKKLLTSFSLKIFLGLADWENKAFFNSRPTGSKPDSGWTLAAVSCTVSGQETAFPGWSVPKLSQPSDRWGINIVE